MELVRRGVCVPLTLYCKGSCLDLAGLGKRELYRNIIAGHRETLCFAAHRFRLASCASWPASRRPCVLAEGPVGGTRTVCCVWRHHSKATNWVLCRTSVLEGRGCSARLVRSP